MPDVLQLWGLASGPQAGVYNMALDELLLEHLRTLDSPTLVIRTYTWQQPTLSLGVHQPGRDLPLLRERHPIPRWDWVRRPTGGRAIAHGEDIAFSFVTNDPALLRLSLTDSYCHFTLFLKTALTQLGIALLESCEDNTRAYTRSSLCFETHTPSDLLDAQGHKIAGSAQLRRSSGILQHGSAFVKAHPISEPQLAAALFTAASQHYNTPLQPLPEDASFWKHLPELTRRYQREASSLVQSSLDKTPTRSGSHLEPASF